MLPDLLLNPHAFEDKILNCFTLFLVLVLVTIEFTGLVHVGLVESQLDVVIKSLLLLRFSISVSWTGCSSPEAGLCRTAFSLPCRNPFSGSLRGVGNCLDISSLDCNPDE